VLDKAEYSAFESTPILYRVESYRHWHRQGQRSCTTSRSYHVIWSEPWETCLSR